MMVNITRMLIYDREAGTTRKDIDWLLVAVATVSAFVGAFIGSRLIRKITIHAIQLIVSALLVVVALGLISGLL